MFDCTCNTQYSLLLNQHNGDDTPKKKSSTQCLKRDGTRAETRFGLSEKQTCPFKLAGVSVKSTTGSRSVRTSSSNGSNAGYTMF